MAQKAKGSTSITVRHGSSLAHVKTVDEAAALMQRLDSRSTPRQQDASGPSPPTLGGAATSILAHAAELPALLGAKAELNVIPDSRIAHG